MLTRSYSIAFGTYLWDVKLVCVKGEHVTLQAGPVGERAAVTEDSGNAEELQKLIINPE